MFRFTQEPFSGSLPVLGESYIYGFLCVHVDGDVVNGVAAYQL